MAVSLSSIGVYGSSECVNLVDNSIGVCMKGGGWLGVDWCVWRATRQKEHVLFWIILWIIEL